MGWYLMALVDTLPYYPPHDPGRETLLTILRSEASAVVRYQDVDTGLWFQVMDKANAPCNYPESSASCMFVYALAKGVRLGYLPSRRHNHAAHDTVPLSVTTLAHVADVLEWHAVRPRQILMRRSILRQSLPPFLIFKMLSIKPAANHLLPDPATVDASSTGTAWSVVKWVFAGLGVAAVICLIVAGSQSPPPVPASPTAPLVTLASPATWPESKPEPLPRVKTKPAPPPSDQHELDEMMTVHYVARLPKP